MLNRKSSALSSLRRPSLQRARPPYSPYRPIPDIVLILVAVPLGYLIYASLQTASPGAPNAEFTMANIVAFFTEERFFGHWGTRCGWAFLSVSRRQSSEWEWPGSWLARTSRSTVPSPPWSRFRSSSRHSRLGIAWFLLGSENSGLINTILRLVLGAEAGIVNIMSFSGLLFVMTLAFVPPAYLFTLGPTRQTWTAASRRPH